jgi:hypothetical protein
MATLSRRSLLRGSFTLATAGALMKPYIVNGGATTATVWWSQGFAQEEDISFKKIVADYEKASGNTIDYSIMPYGPFRPQTNGMVERFNRRLGEHLARMPQNRAAHHRRFVDHAERDAYLHSFVADYNRSRLRCLDYQTPAELLANLAGHNTFAGTARVEVADLLSRSG